MRHPNEQEGLGPQPAMGRPGTPSRRALLSGGAGVAAGALLASSLDLVAAPAASAQEVTGDRIVMLGVSGGPLLLGPHFQPAVALVVSGHIYLVDCGADTARQITRAGLGFAALQHVFLTHRHPDHTAGLPALRLLGWSYTPSHLAALTVWGPPPTQNTIHEVEEAFAEEVALFEAIGSPAIPVVGRTLRYPAGRDGIYRVMEDERVIVDLTRVFHGPEVPYAYAYRFTIKATGKKVVFSGDTTAPNANLIRLSHNADVLVHEVMDVDAIAAIIGVAPPAQQGPLRAHLLNSHADVRKVPAVAKAANARRVVMCHYIPAPVPPDVYLAQARLAAAQIGYTGAIVAPTDLDVIAI
jgi:ribonuclease BN (tRNA processing enzyme)